MENTKRGRGRPLGAVSAMTKASREAAMATGLLPHEILLSMARGEPQVEYHYDQVTGQTVERYVSMDIEQRKDAAKAAAPYYAPKISTVEVIKGVSDDELDSIIAQLAAQTGFGNGNGGEEPEDEAEPGEGSRSRRRILE